MIYLFNFTAEFSTLVLICADTAPALASTVELLKRNGVKIQEWRMNCHLDMV